MLADIRRGSTRDGAQPGAILFLHTVVRKTKTLRRDGGAGPDASLVRVRARAMTSTVHLERRVKVEWQAALSY
jgi:hypothetical protein